MSSMKRPQTQGVRAVSLPHELSRSYRAGESRSKLDRRMISDQRSALDQRQMWTLTRFTRLTMRLAGFKPPRGRAWFRSLHRMMRELRSGFSPSDATARSFGRPVSASRSGSVRCARGAVWPGQREGDRRNPTRRGLLQPSDVGG